MYQIASKINNYELNLLNDIRHRIIYQPQDNIEIQEAVYLWLKNREEALEKYGHISLWDTSRITSMRRLFDLPNRDNLFNDDISKWDVSNVTDMSYMFNHCIKFNQNISCWNMSNVERTTSMFHGCMKFNQPIGIWDMSKVIDMSYMFRNCDEFDQSLKNWGYNVGCNYFRMFNKDNSMSSQNLETVPKYIR